MRNQMFGYTFRVVMSGNGMLHLAWMNGRFPGRAMCGRSVKGWGPSSRARWEREVATSEGRTRFVCEQCRGPLGPNATIKP